jgi:hypothetical protein
MYAEVFYYEAGITPYEFYSYHFWNYKDNDLIEVTMVDEKKKFALMYAYMDKWGNDSFGNTRKKMKELSKL